MAGHSKFKNIQHRKGAQDKKRAKIFGRLIKELTVAARGGTDPASNPRLRTALAAARAANMPKDNIERVIKKAEGGEGEVYDEIRYEGYGPGGTALIVEAMTDNKNRTASEVRAAFSKFGGSLGETGSVNVESNDEGHEITCAPEDYNSVVEALEASFGAPAESGLVWKPQNTIEVNEDQAGTLIKLLDTLDDNDDVQNVSSNFDISDEIMARLA